MLYYGDCMDMMKRIPDESVDCIVTDPPYRVTPKGSSGRTTTGGMLVTKKAMEGKIFEHNDIPCKRYAPEFYRVLKDGTHCYVMTNHVNLIEMLNTFTSVGFHFIKSLIWDKGNKIMGRYYMSQFEYILMFRKGSDRVINDCGTSDILSIRNIKMKGRDGNNLHDCEKPVELFRILISNSTEKGDTVMDPFMGIGAAGVACRVLGRDFIGAEIDSDYYHIAEKRIITSGVGGIDVFTLQ